MRFLRIIMIIIFCWCWNIILSRDIPEYSYTQCLGSASPYPEEVGPISYPDSLMPVMINHVGRHGARFPASKKPFEETKAALQKACIHHTITPLGYNLLNLIDSVLTIIDGRWGELDSLGEAEQRAIARRMYSNFNQVFDSCHINAISSYVPRAMMSMYVFNHQLDLIDHNIDFYSTTGRVNSPLMRPFEINQSYIEFIHSAYVSDIYHEYFVLNCPERVAFRILGDGYPFSDIVEIKNLAYDEYKVLMYMQVMSVNCNLSDYFTLPEINALWRCFNLHQYLEHSASALSTIPADIAKDLLRNIIDTTDDYINGHQKYKIWLRFGHAETLMPLLSLMDIPGCQYITSDFNTVAKNWRDFDIIPMAANLQIVLFKSVKSGQYYIMTFLNESPVSLLHDSSYVIPWYMAKEYLSNKL